MIFHKSKDIFPVVKESSLLPLLRSRLQGDLLALLYLNPDKEYSVTALAGLVGASVPGVHHEVTRLLEAGLLKDRRVGNTRLVSAGSSSPVTDALAQLLLVTYGPRIVIANELATVGGVDYAFIYGSWAARYEGHRGAPPNDIDVLVVGRADLDELDDAAARSTAKLQHEVSMRRVSNSDWSEAQTGKSLHAFLASILESPMVELQLDRTASSDA